MTVEAFEISEMEVTQLFEPDRKLDAAVLAVEEMEEETTAEVGVEFATTGITYRFELAAHRIDPVLVSPHAR